VVPSRGGVSRVGGGNVLGKLGVSWVTYYRLWCGSGRRPGRRRETRPARPLAPSLLTGASRRLDAQIRMTCEFPPRTVPAHGCISEGGATPGQPSATARSTAASSSRRQ